MQTTPLPICNLDAELAVLGSILIDNQSILKALDNLNASDFYRTQNQVIYATMLEMHKSSIPIDVVTLKNCLEHKGLLKKAGDAQYITLISGATPTAVSIKHYADIVKDNSYRRASVDIVENIKQQIQAGAKIEDVISSAESSLRHVIKDNSSKCKPIKAGLDEALKELTDPQHKDNAIPTGFLDIDRNMKGFIPTCFYILAGRPAMGKTAFALNVATNIAKQGKKVLIFSMEMSINMLQKRILCATASVGKRSAETNKSDINRKKLTDAAQKVSELPILIDDSRDVTTEKIRSVIMRCKLEFGVDMVIIDYLQLMRPSNKSIVREQQVSEISSELVSMAMEFNVPILALSQLNRECEKRPDKRPNLSDLRESGSLEQDAYMVMMLYRGIVYKEKGATINDAELIIAKHREGEEGDIALHFNPELMQFGNKAREERY